jgi:tetratricopeptide (TPR) repeat protein
MSAFLSLALLAAPSWGQDLPELLVKIHWARQQLGQPPLAGPEEELLALGIYLQGTGRDAEARAIFHQILARYPDSPDLGEVWLGIGDTHEGEGDHEAAHAAYVRASSFLTDRRRAARWPLLVGAGPPRGPVGPARAHGRRLPAGGRGRKGGGHRALALCAGLDPLTQLSAARARSA